MSRRFSPETSPPSKGLYAAGRVINLGSIFAATAAAPRKRALAVGLLLALDFTLAPSSGRPLEHPTRNEYLQIFARQFTPNDAAVPADVRHWLTATSAQEATDSRRDSLARQRPGLA